MEEADVIFNCDHSEQLDTIYAAGKDQRIINIGSMAGDGIKKYHHRYAVEKAALDKANEQLYYQGYDTTVIRFGYFDSDRVKHIDAPKLSLEEVEDIILWVLESPHRIKELSIESRVS